MVTFKQSMNNLAADIRRRKLLEEKGEGIFATLSILFKPGVVAVILYRISRYLIHTRFKFLCKAIGYINYFYTGSEISPLADLGPGLVIADCGAAGIPSIAIAGKNCTLLGATTITLGAIEGFNLETDRIEIGDHCVVGSRVRIMRPVKVADGTQIKNNSIVMFSIDKVGSVVSGFPAKRRSVESLEKVLDWNPIKGGPIKEVIK